jgi:carboxy-terminal domain RNA polymerase II polypeptide A small phosphatase
LLKKELYFSPEILIELKKAQRFGKEPIHQQYAVIPRQLKEHRGRKTLILDLDETLIHSKFSLAQVKACRAKGKADFQMRIIVEGRPIQVFVLIRPGVQFFLQRLAQMYELVIYTASMSIYANPLVDTIDPDRHIPFRLFRDHCFSYQGSYIKDLSLLGRPMQDVIIVDNSPNAYYFHPENSVPILSWYDDPDDRCLFEMIPLLEALSQVNDVR